MIAAAHPDRLPAARLDVERVPDGLALAGALVVATLHSARAAAAALPPGARIDAARLDAVDTAGALLLADWAADGHRLTGLARRFRDMQARVASLEATDPPAPGRPAWHGIARLGRHAEASARRFVALLTFTGRTAAALVSLVRHPSGLRPGAISHHLAAAGADALGIVGLLAVMISVVIAYQGVAQLRPYGGQDLTIDLVAVSVLREMAVLVTAIMVAGRSGAAFAAELGVMKAREEIDALRVMGLDPIQLLVVPRLMALVIALPLLTFFADVMGLLGGAVVSQVLLDVAPWQYLPRVREAADAGDLAVGLIKAPVFAVVIALVGCLHGLSVTPAADSVGRETTRAVVSSIFLVIVLDALFSVLFEKVGL